MRAQVAEQLRRVSTWELEAQADVKRSVDDMPPLIADTLLNDFDIKLEPGADAPGLDD